MKKYLALALLATTIVSLGLLLGCAQQAAETAATTTTTSLSSTSTTSSSTTTTTFNPVTAKVVYTVYNGSNKNIGIMNLDGTSAEVLTSDNDSWFPIFTPAKNKVIYQKSYSEMHVMNVDGSNSTRISTNAIEPSITPDGTQIYYAYYDGVLQTLQIYKMSLDGSNPTAVTSLGTDTWGPKILPSGNKFLFNSNAATGLGTLEDVYIADINGSNVQRLTSAEGIYNNYYPTISPDDSKFIYFSSVSGGNSELYLMNIDGTGKTLLSNATASYSASNGEPSFSPDGSTVVFQSIRSGTFEVYKVNNDGSGLTQLTNTPAENYKPQYLPNGRILFISERDGRPQLYVMDADGGNPMRLSDNTNDIDDGTPYSTEKPNF